MPYPVGDCKNYLHSCLLAFISGLNCGWTPTDLSIVRKHRREET